MTKSRLKRFFHLTPEEYEKIKSYQEWHPEFSLLLGKRNCFDHDHRSGRSRGLLEFRINRALGMLERVCYGPKLSKILRALAKYNESCPATEILGHDTFGIMGEARYKKIMKFGPPPGHLEKSK